LFILDAGSGIRELGADLIERGTAPMSAHILLSHTHWDHIQGFPFFAPGFVAQNEFRVYGTREGDRRFFNLLSGQMHSDYFPISFSAFKAAIIPDYLNEGEKRIGAVQVRSHALHHPGGSLGYALTADGRKIVYATDNEIKVVAEKAESDPLAGLRLAPPALVEFARAADLLIADGQYTDEEYPARLGWGHSSCFTTVDLAIQAQAKQLAVFHHDPTHSDADVDVMIENCRRRAARFGSPLQIFAARERVELKIA
jgi:phosphoribosyl 1,2-cyclic phosphodiesterase